MISEKKLCHLSYLVGFLDVRIKGGLDLKTQEAALRQRPDIVIATPGRLIDHLHNAPNFSLADVEVLFSVLFITLLKISGIMQQFR